ncbi:MAG: hypothetical protein WAU78_05965 [Roseiarcus sp.]|jgi:hypothetical protein
MIRLAAPISAVVLWLLSVVLILWTVVAALIGDVASVPLAGALLAQAELIQRIAPIATLALFAWVLALLALRARRVWAESVAADRLAHVLSGSPDQATLMALGADTRAGQRARTIANGLRGRGDLHDALPGAASLDATALQTSYAGFHVYAWILPVLGFIGTAVAMSAAIGGFASALTETTKIEALIAKLAQMVIPGLAAAFGATVLALVAALVTYLATVALQTLEEEALETCDAASMEFLSRVGRPHTASGGVDPTVAALLRQILAALERLSIEHERPLDVLDRAAAATAAVESAARGLEGAAGRLGDAAATLQETARMPYHVTVTRGSEP